MHHLCALGSLSRFRNRKPIFCDAFLSGVDIVAVNFCGTIATLWFLLGDFVFICLSSSSEKSRLLFEFLKGISTAGPAFLPFQTGVFCKELYFSFHVLDKLPSFKLTRAFAEEPQHCIPAGSSPERSRATCSPRGRGQACVTRKKTLPGWTRGIGGSNHKCLQKQELS